MRNNMRTFYLEAISETFKGYAANDHWNGYKNPYFTKEIGLKVAEAWNGLVKDWGEGYAAWYDEKKDAFCFQDPNHEKHECEMYDCVDMQLDGKLVQMYQIGKNGWTWCEVE